MFTYFKLEATKKDRPLHLFTVTIGKYMFYIGSDLFHAVCGLNIVLDNKFKSKIFRFGYDQQF